MAKSEDRVVSVDEVRAAWFRHDAGEPEWICAQARHMGVEPDAVDVFGRPAFTPAAIAKWSAKRDVLARAAGDHEAAWAQAQRDSKAWQARRTAAVRDAQEAESRKPGKRGGADFAVGTLSQGPEDYARVRAAGRHAGEQFERANPRPRINGNTLLPLVYLDDESEEGSLVARAVGAVRGPKVTDADREVAAVEVL
ncbi:hypothetical protein [Micromonospora sp. U21]|uniref:hypothetical protein n=1 Tax=Micromonospora sp. U21 TaxID=2824899 RepID=UPI001B36C8CE|nr:hypothetical protein [Micromonospora sp. U21]MBQ0902682.1 hypothetical protein [Micromonospora sp. U21]